MSSSPWIAQGPPPKKKRTGLIIAIIIIIIIILAVIGVVVFILVRRSSTSGNNNTTTRLGCSANSDCSGGKVCRTSTRRCVDCLSDSNCPTDKPLCETGTNLCIACREDSDCLNQICDTTTNKCVDNECDVNADCTTAGEETCVAGRCKACAIDADCVYDAGVDICLDQKCVECTADNQCGGGPNTCTDNFCCNKVAPVPQGVNTSRTMTHTQIANTYVVGGGGAPFVSGVDKIVGKIFALATPNPIYTSAPFNANGNSSIQVPQGLVLLLPNINYQYRIQGLRPCGSTLESAGVNFSVPTNRLCLRDDDSTFQLTDVNIIAQSGSLDPNTGVTLTVGANPNPCSPERSSRLAILMLNQTGNSNNAWIRPNGVLPTEGVLVRNVPMNSVPTVMNGGLFSPGDYTINQALTGETFWQTLYNPGMNFVHFRVWYEQGTAASLPGPSVGSSILTMNLS